MAHQPQQTRCVHETKLQQEGFVGSGKRQLELVVEAFFTPTLEIFDRMVWFGVCEHTCFIVAAPEEPTDGWTDDWQKVDLAEAIEMADSYVNGAERFGRRPRDDDPTMTTTEGFCVFQSININGVFQYTYSLGIQPQWIPIPRS